MSINSQFLLFYIDELVKVHWVDWSEKYLSQKPDKAYLTQRGFQEIADPSGSSTVRTRASDCFKIGLISSKLVNPRKGNSRGIPEGWQEICNDNSIHSHLGYIAYILGKGLKQPIHKSTAEPALNSLVALILLTIGFKYEGRWHTTAFIYSFVERKSEKALSRKLTDHEKRCLAGAVFNTLEFEHIGQLIEAYKNDDDRFNLFYKFRDNGGEQLFDVNQFSTVCNDQNFNINSIERHKACLFWSNPERGHFSRATNSAGYSLILKLASLDSNGFRNNLPNYLSSYYESITSNATAEDLLHLLFTLKTTTNSLDKELKKIMKSLNDGVIDSLDLIKSETDIEISNKFYVHDEVEIKEETSSIELNISKNDIRLIPEIGHSLIFSSGEQFEIISIDEDDENLTIIANR